MQFISTCSVSRGSCFNATTSFQVEGGVYENQPTVLEDVVRCGDQPPEQLLEGVDTRTLRQRFLAQANEAASTKKHNALVHAH